MVPTERSVVDVRGMSLTAILNDPELKAALRVYAAKEFAEENVFFLEDVIALKETKDVNRIREMIAEYIAPEATMEINISYGERARMLENIPQAIETNNMEFFDGAFDEVMQLVSTTVLKRFREQFGKLPFEAIHTLATGVKRVVIVGGGFVGMGVARSLDSMSRFHLTLIDTKDYWEFTPAMVHAMVDPSFADGFRVNHRQYVRNGRVIIATVTDVNNSYVVADGVQYPYDYLVIGTGSSYRTQLLKGRNMTTSYRIKRIQAEYKSMNEAKEVLVIGGGVVGVELAADLKTTYPEKNVTIVEANSNLIRRTPPRAQRLCRNALEKMGVNIIFNERIMQVSEHDHREYITNKGRVIKYDKSYVATGPQPVSAFFKKRFPEAVTENGFIMVDTTLQVVGHPNIFCGGDVCSLRNEKLAMTALQHGIAISRNICRVERGLKPAHMGTHAILPTPLYPRHLYIMLGSAGALWVYKNRTAMIGNYFIRFPIHRDDKFMAMAHGRLPVNFMSGLSRPPRKLSVPKVPKRSRSKELLKAAEPTTPKPEAEKTDEEKPSIAILA